MKFYHFLEVANIHVLDYSGRINEEELFSRMQLLEKPSSSYVSNGVPFKVLLDFRNAIWESLELHNAISKKARQKADSLPKNIRRYTAILNNQYTFPTFENEHMFTSKEEALNWLFQQGQADDS